jgi:hypothetical protein
MRQPAHGCNFRAKAQRLGHFILAFLRLVTAMLVSLPTGFAGDRSG